MNRRAQKPVRLVDLTGLVELRTFSDLPLLVAIDGRSVSIGKGFSRSTRAGSARGERLERRLLRTAAPTLQASTAELGVRAVSPPMLGLDLPGERPAGVQPYNAEARVGWIQCTSLGGERRWVHSPGWWAGGFWRPTSNGVAVADNHEAAIEAAVGELLERDAFVRWWYQLDASRPLWASSSRWRALVAWFSGLGWELTVHRLPGPTRLPVLLAAAIRRDESNATVGSVIGLAAAHIGQSIADVMCTAAAEIVQAVEGFSICAAVGRAPVGDLAAFLTPQRASTVAKLLAVGVDEDGTDSSGAVSAVDAADEAGLSVWLADLAPPGSSLSCVQAYSPDTMPFPATNRGRRLDHPALRGRLTELGRELESVPMLPHPLG